MSIKTKYRLVCDQCKKKSKWRSKPINNKYIVDNNWLELRETMYHFCPKCRKTDNVKKLNDKNEEDLHKMYSEIALQGGNNGG